MKIRAAEKERNSARRTTVRGAVREAEELRGKVSDLIAVMDSFLDLC
jgi:hypothetical protein